MNVKAVILAAGLGSRLCPLTPFCPKEMLPIGGYPAIHHILYEIAESGISEVLAVLSEEKASLREYFDREITPKGEQACTMAKEREEILSKLRITVALQQELRGTADAIYLAKEFMGKDDLLVVFPDDILSLSKGGLSDGVRANRRLIAEAKKSGESVLLVQEIPRVLASSYGVVRMRNRGEGFATVTDIVEKPQNYTEDRAHAMIGRMLLTPRLVATIPDLPVNDREGSVPALNSAAERGELLAMAYDGRRFDIGSHDGYESLLRAVYAGVGI